MAVQNTKNLTNSFIHSFIHAVLWKRGIEVSYTKNTTDNFGAQLNTIQLIDDLFLEIPLITKINIQLISTTMTETIKKEILVEQWSIIICENSTQAAVQRDKSFLSSIVRSVLLITRNQPITMHCRLGQPITLHADIFLTFRPNDPSVILPSHENSSIRFHHRPPELSFHPSSEVSKISFPPKNTANIFSYKFELSVEGCFHKSWKPSIQSPTQPIQSPGSGKVSTVGSTGTDPSSSSNDPPLSTSRPKVHQRHSFSGSVPPFRTVSSPVGSPISQPEFNPELSFGDKSSPAQRQSLHYYSTQMLIDDELRALHERIMAVDDLRQTSVRKEYYTNEFDRLKRLESPERHS